MGASRALQLALVERVYKICIFQKEAGELTNYVLLAFPKMLLITTSTGAASGQEEVPVGGRPE